MALKRSVVKHYEKAVKDGVITRAEADAKLLKLTHQQEQAQSGATQGQKPPRGE